jgi:hypothetical protein
MGCALIATCSSPPTAMKASFLPFSIPSSSVKQPDWWGRAGVSALIRSGGRAGAGDRIVLPRSSVRPSRELAPLKG